MNRIPNFKCMTFLKQVTEYLFAHIFVYKRNTHIMHQSHAKAHSLSHWWHLEQAPYIKSDKRHHLSLVQWALKNIRVHICLHCTNPLTQSSSSLLYFVTKTKNANEKFRKHLAKTRTKQMMNIGSVRIEFEKEMVYTDKMVFKGTRILYL